MRVSEELPMKKKYDLSFIARVKDADECPIISVLIVILGSSINTETGVDKKIGLLKIEEIITLRYRQTITTATTRPIYDIFIVNV